MTLENYLILPIAVICYIVGDVVKKSSLIDSNYIPDIVAVLGMVLSIVIFLTTPSMIPAENIYDAILYGFASGMLSTGFNEIMKSSTTVKLSDTETLIDTESEIGTEDELDEDGEVDENATEGDAPVEQGETSSTETDSKESTTANTVA